jgi:hypothetical protein
MLMTLKKRDNDHVQVDGMYQVVANGKQYMMHGTFEVVDHEQIEKLLLKI